MYILYSTQIADEKNKDSHRIGIFEGNVQHCNTAHSSTLLGSTTFLYMFYIPSRWFFLKVFFSPGGVAWISW